MHARGDGVMTIQYDTTRYDTVRYDTIATQLSAALTAPRSDSMKRAGVSRTSDWRRAFRDDWDPTCPAPFCGFAAAAAEGVSSAPMFTIDLLLLLLLGLLPSLCSGGGFCAVRWHAVRRARRQSEEGSRVVELVDVRGEHCGGEGGCGGGSYRS